MAWEGPVPGPGRPKGAGNRISRAFRDDIWSAYKELGGVKWLVQLGRTEPHLIAGLIARLLPRAPVEEVEAAIKRIVDMSDEEIHGLFGEAPPDLGNSEPPTIDEPPLLPPPRPWERS